MKGYIIRRSNDGACFVGAGWRWSPKAPRVFSFATDLPDKVESEGEKWYRSENKGLRYRDNRGVARALIQRVG
jgi:hypothetical protein